MSEYIKKSDVLNKEFEAEINTYDGKYDSSVAYVVLASDIYKMPAEDVAPVVHGRWIDDTFCSICNRSTEDADGHIVLSFSNYCPNCGAKMDGGVKA